MLGSGPGSGRMAAALAWLAYAWMSILDGGWWWAADGGWRRLRTADAGGLGLDLQTAQPEKDLKKKKKNLTIFMKQQVFNRKFFKHMVTNIENTMVFHTNVEKP